MVNKDIFSETKGRRWHFVTGPILQLASQSPRRQLILRQFNIPFISIKNTLHTEPNYTTGSIRSFVRQLAQLKAHHCVPQTSDWILTADTIVVINNQVLGKPTNPTEAAHMLHTLSGNTHNVITAICLTHPKTHQQYTRTETTHITFSTLSDNDIHTYITSKTPFDKAGSYGIQDIPKHFLNKRNGCFYNVMGLPIYTLKRLLKQIG